MEVQNKFCLWNANYISNFEFDITVYVPYVSTVQQTFWYSGRMTVIIIRLFLVENRPFLTPDVGPPHINFHIPIVRIYHRLLISKGHTMLDNISENDHRFSTLVFFYGRSNTSDVIDMLSQICESYQTWTRHPPWKISTKVKYQSYELKKSIQQRWHTSPVV